MFAKTYGATTLGIDGRMIDVELDVFYWGFQVLNWWAYRYVGEGVEGAGDSPSRLTMLLGRSAEYRSGILVFAAIFHQQAGLNLINGEK